MHRTGLTNFLFGKKGLHVFFLTFSFLFFFFKNSFSELLRPNMEPRQGSNSVKHVFGSKLRNLWNPPAWFSGWNAAASGNINLRDDHVRTYQLVSSQLLDSLKHRPKVYCEKKENKNKDQYHRRGESHSNTLFPSSTIRMQTLLKALIDNPSSVIAFFLFFGFENPKQGPLRKTENRWN